MARSCKVLRTFFMSKNSALIWKASRTSMELPDCPSDLSEPQYADLLFAKGCYVRRTLLLAQYVSHSSLISNARHLALRSSASNSESGSVRNAIQAGMYATHALPLNTCSLGLCSIDYANEFDRNSRAKDEYGLSNYDKFRQFLDLLPFIEADHCSNSKCKREEVSILSKTYMSFRFLQSTESIMCPNTSIFLKGKRP